MSTTAFLFDLNGTIIDDMDFHVRAWSQLLEEDLGHKMEYEAVKAQMYGKNSELFERVFGKGHLTDERMLDLSFKKERIYQALYRPHIQLMDGLDEFLKKAYALQIPMAIGSAAIPFNIQFVIDNLGLHRYFKVIVSADDVVRSKPDPETYLQCAKILSIPATQCIVFEDAPKGVESARNAGMRCVVILGGLHRQDEFAGYDNILRFIHSYDELEMRALIN